MKRLMSVALAALLTLGSAAAFADDRPSQPQVNPKQRGYSAYTETAEGRSYRQTVERKQESKTVNPKQSGYSGPLTTYVPPAGTAAQQQQWQMFVPGTYFPPWVGLTVGQYFAWEGQVYMVAYFTTAGYSTVMVAYLVNTYGYADPLFPRYFYL